MSQNFKLHGMLGIPFHHTGMQAMFSNSRDILVIAQEEVDVFERAGRQTSLELIEEVKRLRREVEALRSPTDRERLLTAQAIVNLRFPVMLRKMWSGAEVQAWLAHQSDAIQNPQGTHTDHGVRGKAV